MKLARFLAAGAVALAVPLAAHAQYRAKPVRILVGYVAGSSTDIVGRVMAASSCSRTTRRTFAASSSPRSRSDARS